MVSLVSLLGTISSLLRTKNVFKLFLSKKIDYGIKKVVYYELCCKGLLNTGGVKNGNKYR